jgi:multiple sugar transport system permease protein
VTVFRVIFVLPMIMMPIVVGVLWKFLLHPSYGIINFFLTRMGMEAQAWIANPKLALLTVIGVDVWEWTPFVILILYSGLVSLPVEPFEAARIDGASSWQRFRYLTLPLMKPIMLIVIIMRMIDLIELFDIVFVLTRGGPGNSTMVLTLYNFRMGLNYFNMGKAAALSWIILIMVFILTQLYIRVTKSQFIRG